MSLYRSAIQEITGLTLSGVANAEGEWNIAVDLAAPLGATGVVLRVANTGNTSHWLGLRQTGKTTAHVNEDFPGSTTRHYVVPIQDGKLDIHVEHAQLQIYVVAFTGPSWVFFDIDSAPILLPTRGTVGEGMAPPEIPLNAQALLFGAGFDYAPPGNPARPVQGKNWPLVPLDAENKLVYKAWDQRILGYVTWGVEWDWDRSIPSLVADSAWHKASISAPENAVGVLAYAANTASTDHYGVRPSGSTFDARTDNLSTSSNHLLWTSLDAKGGDFEYWIESTETTPDLRIDAWFLDATNDPGGSPEPEKTKKLKFAGATAVKKADGTGVTATFAYGILYSGDPCVTDAEDYPDILAVIESPSLVNGQAAFVEADCVSGSIDALSTGSPVGWFVFLPDDDETGLRVICPNVSIIDE